RLAVTLLDLPVARGAYRSSCAPERYGSDHERCLGSVVRVFEPPRGWGIHEILPGRTARTRPAHHRIQGTRNVMSAGNRTIEPCRVALLGAGYISAFH